jgi:Fe-S cluster assembly protein SufD
MRRETKGAFMNLTGVLEPTGVSESDYFLAEFERLSSLEPRDTPLWLRAIRKSGIAHFADAGFPSTKNEEWKYTNLEILRGRQFKTAVNDPALEPAAAILEQTPWFHALPRRVVFVNGHFAPGLSNGVNTGQGLAICSLREAIRSNACVVEHHLARHALPSDQPFVALNTAFFQDGAFIHAERNRDEPMPVHLVFIATHPDSGAAFHTRNLIVAETGSRLAVAETYVSLGSDQYFTNSVSEIVVGENATVEHLKVQQESSGACHMATIQAHQGAGSHFTSHSIALGARLARNDIRTVFGGPGAECLMNGLYIVSDHQLTDHHTVIDHAVPNCTSHEHYQGIMAGFARGVFNGKIFVRKDAQKTDARQTNRNLLLSENAVIDTKPQLEIFADDVKCTHGATVGQMSEEALFYLRSRGIGLEEARRMLISAFANQALSRIGIPALGPILEKAVSESIGRMELPKDAGRKEEAALNERNSNG